MTDLRTAAQQALEALESAEVDPHSSDAVYKAITALRAALAEPPVDDPHRGHWVAIAEAAQKIAASTECGLAEAKALCAALDRLTDAALAEPVQEPAQQDNETIVQTFAGLPKRKLRELLAAGWQINGVCFQRTEEDGTVRRGAATTGGMVLWWNQEQPAQQQEPVAWRYQDARGNYRYRGYVQGFDKEYSRLKPFPLYAAPPPRELSSPEAMTLKPLTEQEIWDAVQHGVVGGIGLPSKAIAVARAVEQAHGIKE